VSTNVHRALRTVAKAFPTVWITTNAFAIQRVYNTIWAGFKYAVNARLDVMGAFYYAWQNNFSTTPCTGQGIHISSSSCAGTLDTLSLLIDYRPVKRVDVYADVALSNVYASLANGFQQTQNIDPTVGVRIKF
jgi:predicted porin